ncbi:hypothetical protein JCM10212_007014 [Sporobolomyces blumeae]
MLPTASAQSSPRSKRLSRPLPFTVAIPTPGTATFNQPTTLQDPFNSYSSPRPLRSGHYREAISEVHSVLYGQKGKDRERVIYELYDANAVFENPLSLAKGRDAIADLFGLLELVPGVGWSELGDVTESQSFDGHRLVTFTHTLHLELLPFLHSEQVQSLSDPTATPNRRRAYSIFSLPSTPFPQTPSASIRDSFFGTPSPSAGVSSKTHPAISVSGVRSLLSLLSPRLVASALTTLHIKLHSQLLFNEEGRIIKHEDVWGLKELFEGLFPVAAFAYSLNRQGLSWAAGALSRRLVGRNPVSKGAETQEAAPVLSNDPEPSTIQTPEEEEVSSFPIQKPSLMPLEMPKSNGLGLVGGSAGGGGSVRAATTMDSD